MHCSTHFQKILPQYVTDALQIISRQVSHTMVGYVIEYEVLRATEETSLQPGGVHNPCAINNIADFFGIDIYPGRQTEIKCRHQAASRVGQDAYAVIASCIQQAGGVISTGVINRDNFEIAKGMCTC